MIQTVTAIERDGMDLRALTVQFRVPGTGDFDLMDAIQKAATAYAKTESGRRTLEYNCGGFNLADFVASVPNELCELYGFRRVDDTLSDIEIDWDKQLVEEDSDYACENEDTIHYREYVLSECKRQWAEMQESEYGPWEKQHETDRRAYFKDMYHHLWEDRFGLDMVIIPDVYETDAWEKVNR